jgi:hypothetical protein
MIVGYIRNVVALLCDFILATLRSKHTRSLIFFDMAVKAISSIVGSWERSREVVARSPCIRITLEVA